MALLEDLKWRYATKKMNGQIVPEGNLNYVLEAAKNKRTPVTAEQIKANAKTLFLSYGLKSVSMDDVSKRSGISKKTLYQHFEDKNVLVYEIVMDLIQLHVGLLNNFQTTAKDAIDEAVTLDTDVFGLWTNIRPRFFYELEKFYPEAWLELEYYTLKIRNFIIGNLDWGREEGLYRNDINVVLIAELWIHQQISLLKSQFATTQKMSTDQLAGELAMLCLRSITTDKGEMLLNCYLKKEVHS